MTQPPNGFAPQIIEGTDADIVIALLQSLTQGPREAMALLALTVKKLNSNPDFRTDIPTNEELANEILITLNSIQRVTP